MLTLAFCYLNQPARKLPQVTLKSDPSHPVSDPYNAYGAHDYRALVGREDVLTFDSEPLPADTEVTGPIKLELFVSADVSDFDLWGRLLDVAPDGTAFNLMSPGLDVLRASYRNESLQPELLIPGKIYKLDLDRLLTSNTFLKGHKIRVQISGAFYPHFSRNLQTGKSEIVSKESRVGRISISLDPGGKTPRIILQAIEPKKIVGLAAPNRLPAPRCRRYRAWRAISSGAQVAAACLRRVSAEGILVVDERSVP